MYKLPESLLAKIRATLQYHLDGPGELKEDKKRLEETRELIRLIDINYLDPEI